MSALTSAMNYPYYAERLADPGLLEKALVTEHGDLAVPVGGSRQGGWTSVTSRAEGERLIERMREQPDLFPDPRFDPRSSYIISFGGTEPDDAEAAGRFFGYSETAIRTFLLRVQAQRELRRAQSQRKRKRS